jgi:hypothetical protein
MIPWRNQTNLSTFSFAIHPSQLRENERALVVLLERFPTDR